MKKNNVNPFASNRLKTNKSRTGLKKKDSLTPPGLSAAMTERKITKLMNEDTDLPVNNTERSLIFNTNRRSISKNPPTLEEAKVPLNSAKRAMRKMEKSLESQVVSNLVESIENRKTMQIPEI